MRAAVYRSYGGPEVVQIQNLPQPEPGPSEVLIRIHFSTVSSADARARSLNLPKGFGLFGRPVFGIFAPRKKILGSEFSGVIEKIGSQVTRFKKGDQVFGYPGFQLGSHAQYKVMNQNGRILTKPTNLDLEQSAALCFGGSTALHYVRTLAKAQKGEKVLIVGPVGSVGSACVQIAKHSGAEVWGLVSSTNEALAKSIGCDHTLNYQETQPFSKAPQFDVILDTIGAAGVEHYEVYLSKSGRLGLLAASLYQMFQRPKNKSHRVLVGPAPERLEDLMTLKDLAEQGHFKPLIHQRFSLDQIQEAHRLVDSGRKKGNVIVQIQ